ncbi:MAG: helix-turn-helix transcriptional regulator [Muribaculaceae bacterium]|nr:helix-turn-helix transcriptional regulator [Muribaculaceae bacterium]
MNFKEYYKKLKDAKKPPSPAQQFIITLSAKTGKSQKTVRQWLSGIQIPSGDAKRIISEETGIPAEELFPLS